MSDSLQPRGPQHSGLPCPSLSPGVYSDSCPLSQWCHPTISYCWPFFLLLSIFPSIRVFSVSWLFASGGQSIGTSVSASILPINIQCWFTLGLTGWISLQSKGLSRAFSNTTVQKHQFFSTQPSLGCNSHTRTWLLERPQLWLDWPLLTTWCLYFIMHWNAKVRATWSNRQIWPWSTNEAGQRLTEFCQENALVIPITLFQQHKRRLYTWTSPDGQY